jgi:hypothetical protein
MPCLEYCKYYSATSLHFDKQNFKFARLRHLNKIVNSLMTWLSVFKIFVVILKNGKDCRSLSNIILDLNFFFMWWRHCSLNFCLKFDLESHRIKENTILTPKSRNLNRKKFSPLFCMKTFHCGHCGTKLCDIWVNFYWKPLIHSEIPRKISTMGRFLKKLDLKNNRVETEKTKSNLGQVWNFTKKICQIFFIVVISLAKFQTQSILDLALSGSLQYDSKNEPFFYWTTLHIFRKTTKFVKLAHSRNGSFLESL